LKREIGARNSRGSLEAGSEVVSVRCGSWRGFIVREYAGGELMDLFSNDEFPGKAFIGKVEKVKSKKERSYLFRVHLNEPKGERVFYAKSFCSRSWSDALRGIFIPIEASRSWMAAWIMTEEGIPTPRPVALMEQRVLGVRRRSVFINEAIRYSRGQSLEHYFREKFDLDALPPELVREKREIIRLIGEMYRKAHSQDRLYFPDFHPHNMIFQKSPSGKIRLFLVDFDEVRFNVRANDRTKNLASLCRNADKIVKKMKHRSITTGDRLRLIKAYLGPEHRTRRDSLALWDYVRRNRDMR